MKLSTSILLIGALMLFACGGDQPAGKGGSVPAGTSGGAAPSDGAPGATPVVETELVVLDIDGMT